jgi:hypothetical protein
MNDETREQWVAIRTLERRIDSLDKRIKDLTKQVNALGDQTEILAQIVDTLRGQTPRETPAKYGISEDEPGLPSNFLAWRDDVSEY